MDLVRIFINMRHIRAQSESNVDILIDPFFLLSRIPTPIHTPITHRRRRRSHLTLKLHA